MSPCNRQGECKVQSKMIRGGARSIVIKHHSKVSQTIMQFIAQPFQLDGWTVYLEYLLSHSKYCQDGGGTKPDR